MKRSQAAKTDGQVNIETLQNLGVGASVQYNVETWREGHYVDLGEDINCDRVFKDPETSQVFVFAQLDPESGCIYQA